MNHTIYAIILQLGDDYECIGACFDTDVETTLERAFNRYPNAERIFVQEEFLSSTTIEYFTLKRLNSV